MLFSHGYAVTPDDYAELLSTVGRGGLRGRRADLPPPPGVPAGPSHADYNQVFTDTRFVLGKVLADEGPTGARTRWSARSIRHRVAIAGQSDGEIDRVRGRLPSRAATHVKAVVAMAGDLGNLNYPVPRDNGIPVMHLMGEADELQPYAGAIQWDRDNLTAPRWMLTLVGGAHAPPYRSPADPRFDGVVETTTDVPRRHAQEPSRDGSPRSTSTWPPTATASASNADPYPTSRALRTEGQRRREGARAARSGP